MLVCASLTRLPPSPALPRVGGISTYIENNQKESRAVDTGILKNLYWLLRFTGIKGREPTDERVERGKVGGREGNTKNSLQYRMPC